MMNENLNKLSNVYGKKKKEKRTFSKIEIQKEKTRQKGEQKKTKNIQLRLSERISKKIEVDK